MEKSIYRYILRHSLPQQIILTVMAVASFPFLYAFYELPKRIINDAIDPKIPEFPVEVMGLEFDQFAFLYLLCGAFLLLVAVNQAFKYVINVYGGISGERMLRRLRYDLYTRVLRFPLTQFRKTSPGEIVTMITAEVEPLGGFIADAFKLPIFQGGYLLVILAFLLIQNPFMALAAIALYPVQFYLIPKLQRRVNLLGKQRVRLVRRISERISETVDGVQEVRAHNATALEFARFSHQLGDIYQVRVKIFIWKFVIKFLNNTINQLGPFAFYAIGGYLVINDALEIGTLMAAIAAHKDLAAPWKELLNYYQRREDARIKFEQVVEQFQPPDMVNEALLVEPENVAPLSGDLAVNGLRFEDDTGTVLVDGTSFAFPLNQHVALVGGAGSGKADIGRLVARLAAPTGGTITVGGDRLSDLPEAVTGRRMGYVGPGSYVFATTVRDNLFYGLKHRPLIAAGYDGEQAAAHSRFVADARVAGNSTDDVNADWIDYAAAGAFDADVLTQRALDVLSMVEMDGDIYAMGFRGVVDPADRSHNTARFLEARHEFRARLSASELSSSVETFDESRYNENATIAENLLFGTPVGETFDPNRLAESPYVIDVLEKAELLDSMRDMGREVASTMIELFADLPPGHEFFERYSFISSEELPDYQVLLTHMSREGAESLSREQYTMLLSLPFKVSSARHRLGIIDDGIRERILNARRLFAENLPAGLRGAVEFFNADKYNAAATVQDNILFGKLASEQAHAAERVEALMGEVVDALDLRRTIMEIGLDFEVGIAGARLSGAQRQKLAIARAVLKRPDLLILNEATTNLDGAAQARLVARLREEMRDRGILWILDRADLARHFDRVLVMRNGRVIEQGAYADLDRDGGALKELTALD